MKMRAIFVTVIVFMIANGHKSSRCPAISNRKFGWSMSNGKALIDAISAGTCKDLSDKCDQCTDLCADPNYSHWTETMCAKTCGLCHDASEVEKRQSGTYCWEYGKGYTGANVLKKVPFTSVYECEQLCLKEKDCIGASMTEFYRYPTYCVLAKSGDRSAISKQFGATKDCMKKSPLKPCSDAWNRCSCCYSRMCGSSCPYYKSLLGKMCRKTCGICDEKENEEKKEVEWKEIPNTKLVGKVVKKKLSLEEAKKVCSKCGGIKCEGKKACPNCGGINCNGKKCKVIGEIKEEKTKTGFTAYKPQDTPAKKSDFGCCWCCW